MARASIPAGASIVHVHLRVADLDRAVGFYRDLIGFDHQVRFGDQAAFLSAGGYHHLGLNTWESGVGSPPPPGSTGLYHFAIGCDAATKIMARRLSGPFRGAARSA